MSWWERIFFWIGLVSACLIVGCAIAFTIAGIVYDLWHRRDKQRSWDLWEAQIREREEGGDRQD
ncbi:MAG TPA: hypothetical protein VFQ40_04800 [Actinomycetota bacterium]|nr:hypothetical protein [Actinomycetota bacterium]